MADPVRDFFGDANGEWVISRGDFVAVAGATAVNQAIRVRVQLIRGEAYLDESKGVPYFDEIIKKDPDPLVVRSVIGQEIADVPDVVNAVGAQLEVDAATREGSISYVVDTVYSEQPLTGTIEVP